MYCVFIHLLLRDPMFVKVARLFEDGRPLPRHRSIRSQPARVGRLRLIEEYSPESRRNVVHALVCGYDGANVIPRLHDAVVRHIADGCMTISGLERDGVTGHFLGQSWFVQAHSDRDEPT